MKRRNSNPHTIPFNRFDIKNRLRLDRFSSRFQSLHYIWRIVSSPFLVPESICNHTWQPYDLDMAGCTLCGKGHECPCDSCRKQQNDQGFLVCDITGCCINGMSLSELEFIDNIHKDGESSLSLGTVLNRRNKRAKRAVKEDSNAINTSRVVLTWDDISCHGPAPNNCGKKNRYRSWVHSRLFSFEMEKQWNAGILESAGRRLRADGVGMQRIVSHTMLAGNPLDQQGDEDGNESSIHSMELQVLGYTREIMCSDSWVESMRSEMEKMDSKRLLHLSRAMKHFKSNNPNLMPTIHDIACRMLHTMGEHRSLCIPDRDSMERASIWCAGCIVKHIALLNRICRGVISDCKLKGTSIGVLYLLRHGIIIHDVVILPRIEYLHNILPVENHLFSRFGVRAKCITETENVVKVVLRSASRDDLLRFGVTCIDSRL